MDYARNPPWFRPAISCRLSPSSPPLKPYNRSHMQPALSACIPDGFMAAMRLGVEKPHQGVRSQNPAPNQVREVCNFTVLLGLRGQAELNRVGSRSTGKERDTESGNDYFGARYYASSMGRFMSPDEPFADFDPNNPQSWNLYGYVRNNPLTNTDPDGNGCVTQTRNSSTTETVTVQADGPCSGSVADGQSQTYVPGTVTGVSAGADGHSIDIGYTPYDGSSSLSVTNTASAPDANNPGLAPGYGNNAQGWRTLGVTGATVNPIAGVVMTVVSGFIGGGFGAGPEILSILPEETVVIGKMADLNKAALSAGERKLADDLPYQGNPRADWAQNSSKLRSAMSEGKPIRDVSAGNPGSNTGFLRAERNLLQSHGWTLKGEYWVPPGR